MDKFTYTGLTNLARISRQINGVIGIVVFTGIAFICFAGVWASPGDLHYTTVFDDPRVILICLAFCMLGLAWGIGPMYINFLPTIWLDEDGIQISTFIFFRIRIPWNHMIDIGKAHSPKRHILVRARRISIFYCIFGWFYSHSFYPSFLIHEDIQGYSYLVDRIRQGIRDSQRTA